MKSQTGNSEGVVGQEDDRERRRHQNANPAVGILAPAMFFYIGFLYNPD